MRQDRPLSPHVGIYRWQNSNTLSILHRATGFGLTFGLIPLAAWLWGTAYDAELFTCISGFFATILGKFFLFGWTVAFYYHLSNGMRHLNWDFGNGFKLNEMAASGRLIIIFTLVMTIFTWAMVIRKVGL